MNDKELFEEVWKMMIGRGRQAVLSVGLNLIVNVIRQTAGDRKTAEGMFNETIDKARMILLGVHYDQLTGKRRNVHLFTQVMEAPFLKNENVIYPPNS